MAEQSRTISLNVLARMDAFNREFQRKFPNATEKAALQATKKMQSAFLAEERKRVASAKRTADKVSGIHRMAMLATVATVGAASIAMAKQLGDATLGAAQQLMDARNQINDLGNAIGQSNEQLQAFGFAARLSGGSLQELEPSLKAFPKRLDDMARGTGEARAAFERMGLSSEYVNDALNNGVDLTAEIVDKLQNVENVTQRAAFATQIFGEKGTRLLQVLGSKGLDDWVELTKRYAIDVGPEAVDTSARWEAVSGMLEGKLSQLGEAIFEAVVNSEKFTEVAAVLSGMMEALQAAMVPVQHILQAFVQNIAAAGFAARALATGDLDELGRALDYLAEDKLVGLGAEIANVWNRGSETYRLFKEDVDSYMAATDRQGAVLKQTQKQITELAKAEEAAALKRQQALDSLASMQANAGDDQLSSIQKIEGQYRVMFDAITQMIQDGLVTAEEADGARLALAQRTIRDITAEEARLSQEKAAKAEEAARAVAAIQDKLVAETRTDVQKIEAEWAMLAAEIDKLAAQGAMSWEEAMDLKVQATEHAEAKISEIVKARNRERLDDALNIVQDYSDALAAVFDLITRRQMEAFEAEGAAQREHIQGMKDERDAAREAARNADNASARAAAQLRATELDAQIKQAREERQVIRQKHLDAYRASQATAITQTTISGIVAAMQALAQLGPVAGGIAAGAIAITTGASIAAIASEPPPAFFRGGGPLRREGQGEQLVMMHDGERVLNARAVRDLGDGVIDAINAGFGMQSGGGPATVILDGEVMASATARRMRRAGGLREAASQASTTGRRLVYRG